MKADKPINASAHGDAPGWRESAAGGETREQALRRLKIRCWRRGTKEMDLILGGFLDTEGVALTDQELAAFDALIREDDTALYQWVSGAAEAPADHRPMIERIRSRHALR